MTEVVDRAPVAPVQIPYVQWTPIIAGAVAAAALASVLHAFAAAIGLAVGSTAPTWRDASVALWLLSGLYLVLVALAAYGLGGYLAGRLRSTFAPASTDEIEFRDGVHGLLVWSVATLLTGTFLIIGAAAATRFAAPGNAPSGPATSVTGENIISFDIDRLFRGDRRGADGDIAYARAEAARILLTASGHSGIAQDDRVYLYRLVAARTGLALPDAERRSEIVIARAKENIIRARRSTVILAFMAGAAALLGAAASWFAAGVGGKHRDNNAPAVRWTVFGPRPIPRV
jgi:hypothetical protein